METSAFQSFKLAVVSATGLSKDALHIYVGLALFFVVVLSSRKPVRAWLPWCSVLAAAVLGELLDARDDIVSFGRWRWWASAHDVANTLFWPTVLVILSRYTPAFSKEVGGQNVGNRSPDEAL